MLNSEGLEFPHAGKYLLIPSQSNGSKDDCHFRHRRAEEIARWKGIFERTIPMIVVVVMMVIQKYSWIFEISLFYFWWKFEELCLWKYTQNSTCENCFEDEKTKECGVQKTEHLPQSTVKAVSDAHCHLQGCAAWGGHLALDTVTERKGKLEAIAKSLFCQKGKSRCKPFSG